MATAATATTGVAAPPSYPMASIYVGDLAPEVTEAMLFEKFSTSGPVLSIRVCRDAVTRRSLGYAYVNFQQPSDAERALSTMNFDSLAGKPIRLMWSQRDPAARRSGNGNIFIKNLDKDIDNKNIFDTFSLFGSILSCKVATDDEGNSKGYGFIHFETDEAAQKAINSVNGMLLAGKKVFVGPFLPRSAREKERGDSPLRFTNVFVKNFDDKMDKAKLEELFSKFGKITSAIVMLDAEGKSKGFGFVAFAEPEAAAAAVEELNDSLVPDSDKKFFVGRAQKKSERLAELKRKFAAQKAERLQRYQGVNLYVKNLEETVDDEKLRALFEPFGKITSAKVMLDEANRSKGFGFVCYEKTEEASKASAELNGKVFGAKPLYVALAQRKEDRRAQLASQYMQRLAAMRNTGGMHGTIYTPAPGQGGYFVSSNVASGLRSYPPPSGDQRSQQPQAPWAAGYNAPHPSYMVPPQAGYPPGTRTRGVGGVAQQGQRGAYGAGQGARQGVVPRTQINPPHAGQRQVYPPQQQQARPPTNQQGRVESLNTQALAQASIGEQKQVLGDRVYYQIEKLFPGTVDASKVTGMLLEMDTSDLLLALQNDELLRGKVEEAVAALKNATASKQG